MPDLMTGTYTYEALAQKYGNFCVPLIKIKSNGVDLVTTLKISIAEIKATLSLDAASMVVFKINNIYSEKNHEFDSKVKSRFPLGSIMEVELGYQSSSLGIFKGFVAMLGAEFGKIPSLVVTLMDVRRLMMLCGNVHMLHDVKNYSDAFRAVMDKYSKLCSVEVDGTKDELTQPLSQTQNDYTFVTTELVKNGRAGREFFALGKKVYFRKPRKVGQPIMTLKFGRELLALKSNEEYQDLKIEVIGYKEEEQEVIEGNAEVGRNLRLKKLLAQTPSIVITDPCADTKKKAKEKAEWVAGENEWKRYSGQGMTIGLPELVPGRFVEVKALEKDYGDHKYYIKSVVHEIKGEDFKTIFEIGGWQS